MHGVDVDPLRVVVELEAVAELALHAESVRSRKPPCSSYDDVTTASAVAARAVAESCAPAASASGVDSSRSIPASPSGESANAPRAWRAADSAARARREADEIASGAALDAARHVRQVARRARAA